ncbi:amino acid ABC transporter permease, partial [Streptococcus pyogenes]
MDFTQIFNADLWATFFQDWEQFAHGFLFSLLISIGALVTALFLGIIFGAISTTKSKLLRFIARVYVEFYQN